MHPTEFILGYPYLKAKSWLTKSEFYSKEKISGLSKLTGLPVTELNDPSPNIAAIDFLIEKIDWFFDEFLQRLSSAI